MKILTSTHDEAAEILWQIEKLQKTLSYLKNWEINCASRSWPLNADHFDNREFVESEIRKLKGHYKIKLTGLGKLIEQVQC